MHTGPQKLKTKTPSLNSFESKNAFELPSQNKLRLVRLILISKEFVIGGHLWKGSVPVNIKFCGISVKQVLS